MCGYPWVVKSVQKIILWICVHNNFDTQSHTHTHKHSIRPQVTRNYTIVGCAVLYASAQKRRHAKHATRMNHPTRCGPVWCGGSLNSFTLIHIHNARQHNSARSSTHGREKCLWLLCWPVEFVGALCNDDERYEHARQRDTGVC